MSLRDILITGKSAKLPGDYGPQTDNGPGVGFPSGAIAEYRFHPPRRWRFDWAWPRHKLALEIEGGVWTKGRHTRGKGYLADCEKYNQANLDGWCLLRVTPAQMASGEAAKLVRDAISGGVTNG